MELKEFRPPHTEGTPIWTHCYSPKNRGLDAGATLLSLTLFRSPLQDVAPF